MRHKLALTIALAGFMGATAFGVGMAGADPLGPGQIARLATPNTAVALPSAQTPACSNGVDDDRDGLADLNDPDCVSLEGTSEAPTAAPAANGNVPATAGGGFETGATLDAGDAKAGEGSATHNQSLGGGAGVDGGISAPSATGGGDQPQKTSDGGSQFTDGGSPTSGNPSNDDRPVRTGPDRRPQLRHRLLRDPAFPAADLPGLRNRVRDPLGGPRLDQQNRDRLRHQPQRLQRRRARLDAVHALLLGGLRGRRQRRRAQGPLQPGQRDLRRGRLPEGQRRRRRPLQRDLRLQPRRLVRAGGAALRARLRQAALATWSAP